MGVSFVCIFVVFRSILSLLCFFIGTDALSVKCGLNVQCNFHFLIVSTVILIILYLCILFFCCCKE
jgi:hypothetical protein